MPTTTVNAPESRDSRPSIVWTGDRALICRHGVFGGRMAEVVILRFFAGLSVEETARAMCLSERTVKREWAVARAWLFEALRDSDGARG